MARVEGSLNQALHDRSGHVVISHCPLVGFLYDAMRDGVISPGQAEELVRRNTEVEVAAQDGVAYCNGWLAMYAQDMAFRLMAGTVPVDDDWIPEGVVNHEEHDGHQHRAGSIGINEFLSSRHHRSL